MSFRKLFWAKIWPPFRAKQSRFQARWGREGKIWQTHYFRAFIDSFLSAVQWMPKYRKKRNPHDWNSNYQTRHPAVDTHDCGRKMRQNKNKDKNNWPLFTQTKNRRGEKRRQVFKTLISWKEEGKWSCSLRKILHGSRQTFLGWVSSLLCRDLNAWLPSQKKLRK